MNQQKKKLENKPPRPSAPVQQKLPQVFFQMTRERSPNPAKTRLSTKQKDAYERQLKSELLDKSLEIETKLDKRKQCNPNKFFKPHLPLVYESMGIFSNEKNKARVDAARFVAMSKE